MQCGLTTCRGSDLVPAVIDRRALQALISPRRFGLPVLKARQLAITRWLHCYSLSRVFQSFFKGCCPKTYHGLGERNPLASAELFSAARRISANHVASYAVCPREKWRRMGQTLHNHCGGVIDYLGTQLHLSTHFYVMTHAVSQSVNLDSSPGYGLSYDRRRPHQIYVRWSTVFSNGVDLAYSCSEQVFEHCLNLSSQMLTYRCCGIWFFDIDGFGLTALPTYESTLVEYVVFKASNSTCVP
ncbi:uncharacterized protein BDR25DRAFT_363586 [Lindgomyces ingoldianus]|uniref:Uncharacterized protein n=1 Tax=Lindgomyces ingoldianus TaxID=673940 RepID=A0ACB6Q8R7_9PLEO|nr:uncharacterized protein BDR25DRAFT_363586 [Lindgomyces ingoldianus]KAF2462747.1 hypothetical protein BDR25DRAFT_363586 [Lindgomyces ingoldianus]